MVQAVQANETNTSKKKSTSKNSVTSHQAEPEPTTAEAEELAVAEAVNPDQGAAFQKVQELLFGAQAKTIEHKMEQMVTDLKHQITDIQEDFIARMQQFSLEVKEEQMVQELRLKTFEQDFQRDNSRLETDLSRSEQRLAKTIETLKTETDVAFKQVETSQENSVKQLSKDIEQSGKEYKKELEKAVNELSEAKTDREALANIYSDMAKQLFNVSS